MSLGRLNKIVPVNTLGVTVVPGGFGAFFASLLIIAYNPRETDLWSQPWVGSISVEVTW